MRKFICLFLISALCACSMFGCKNKNQNDSSTEASTELNTENPTDSDEESTTQNDESTDSTETESDASEQESSETPNEQDKQSLWEDVFANSKYTLDSYSFVMNAAELMKMSVFTNENGKSYFEVAGFDENGNDMALGFLFNQNEDVYFHRFGVDGDQKIDQWLKCIGMDTDSIEAKEDLDVNDLSNMDAFTAALGAIQKIEYIESIGDIDRLAIHYVPLEESDDEWTTTYDVTIEIEYNGQKGEYRYTEQSTSSGASSNSFSSQSSIEGFSWKEWEFDKETLVLTKGDQTIQCKLVKDHIAENDKNAIIEVEINSKTYAIQKMIMTEDDMEMTIEFVESPNLDELYDLSGDMESIKYEDAMTEFVMGMLAFALSGIQ